MSSPSSFQTRTTPLGVCIWWDGIRVYSQAQSGDLREACGTIDTNWSPSIFTFKPRLWKRGKLHAPALAGTAIAPIQVDNGRYIRIFYQAPDKRLKELASKNLDDKWFDGDFTTNIAAPRTAISAVTDSSLGPTACHVFFQGNDHAIYQSTFTSDKMWSPPRKIVDQAQPLTAISPVILNGGPELRLFYQDTSGAVRDISSTDGQSWALGKFDVYYATGNDFCAVEVGTEVKLYIQEDDNRIREWIWNGIEWSKTDMESLALPNTDVKVVARALINVIVVFLYYVGVDKVLHERTQKSWFGKPVWEVPGQLTTTAQVGDAVGLYVGEPWSDQDSGAGDRDIKSVTIWAGWWVDAMQVEYVDGYKTPMRGHLSGILNQFDLMPNEVIIQVLARGTDRLQTIQFVTSSGRQSPEYGSQNTGAARLNIWEYEGRPLAGFSGNADNLGVRSLEPIWAAEPPRAGVGLLQELTTEAVAIEQDKTTASAKVEEYKSTIPKMKTDLITAVKSSADAAIAEIIKLGDAVVSLSIATGPTKRDHIATCKGQSKKVHDGFESISTLAGHKLVELDKCATDLVFWESKVETMTTRAEEMVQIATASNVSAKNIENVKQAAVDVSQADVDTARKAKEQADDAKSNAERDRILRDLFTVGLGELGDWFDYNHAIDVADEILRTANGNLFSAAMSLIIALENLQAIQSKMGQFTDLKARLSGLDAPLKELRLLLDGQRKDVLDIRTTAFDISVFMGSLTATSAPLESITNAAELASGIQKLQDVIQTNIRLAGPFLTQTQVMNDTLKQIAASDVPPAGLI